MPAIRVEDHAGGKCVSVYASRREVLDLLRDDTAFVAAFSSTLADQPYRGFFWETPPLTYAGLGEAFECMIVPSNAVGELSANADAFADKIASKQGTIEVVSARNLGGDAELVIPAGALADVDYAHLAAFLRTAPAEQVAALWREASATATRWLRSAPDRPIWLSTSGLGVPWLHVRIDTRPKYYSHTPYRTPPR